MLPAVTRPSVTLEWNEATGNVFCDTCAFSSTTEQWEKSRKCGRNLNSCRQQQPLQSSLKYFWHPLMLALADLDLTVLLKESHPKFIVSAFFFQFEVHLKF